jgi:hypothetical protein
MMRQLITLLEGFGSNDEFSTKGHADMKIKRNDPRFGDNPLAFDDEEDREELDELDTSTFHSRSSLSKLHDIFSHAGVSDQEIAHGFHLTDAGMHKIAARLGVSPHEVDMLMRALSQQLSDESDNLEETYQRFIESEDDEAQPDPFAQPADDHLSAEEDYLGNVTIRSSKHGDERFFQGSQAASIRDKLDDAGADEAAQERVMRPLIKEESYEAEIKSDSGSYNFPWKYNGHSGFGTASYNTLNNKPNIKLISVRDASGEDVETDDKMKQNLLAQARDFIKDA